MPESDTVDAALFTLLVEAGDDSLVLGHRLSEWCGHAPILEEDIALANIALDCLGHAANFLAAAGKIENKGRVADDLAFWRDAVDFRNALLVEQANGDFGQTMVRQYLFDAYALLLYEALAASTNDAVQGVAVKAVKEKRYHLRHSREWILRLGGGTEESRSRAQAAVDELWRFTDELFLKPSWHDALVPIFIAPDLAALRPAWDAAVQETFATAGLKIPLAAFQQSGGRDGKHSELLGLMLAEMQSLARSHPGATW
jgi:ring-1,2-phenylacetyl-CoA epoxidase subunit PaaC